MNGLTTSNSKVFFQKILAFPIRQQLADELLHLIRHQLVTNFVNDLLTICF